MNTFKTGRIGILFAAILALVAVSLPGAASAKDRNHDKLPDKWEKAHKLSLKKDQRRLDQDHDGLKNRGEFRAGTNPRDKDSDDDGISDKKERAGIISAYDADAGTLTISLYAGGKLTGSVSEATRVECEDESSGDDDGTDDQGSGDDAEERGRGHEGSGGPGRPGDDESGDDQSDDESGDDETDDQGPGDEAGGEGRPPRGHEGDCDGNCSIDDLAVDVEVTEAEVKFTAGGTVFKKLEIVKVADES
ncbi:MAG: hypothetical protein IPK93_02125 [Solirubrobacterales bacterium]|nr:hypothetical protein [Solirubrobacterales bacterium]